MKEYARFHILTRSPQESKVGIGPRRKCKGIMETAGPVGGEDSDPQRKRKMITAPEPLAKIDLRFRRHPYKERKLGVLEKKNLRKLN